MVWNSFQSCVTVVVSGVDAGVNQTLVGQTGCGDGSHWGGERLAGRTAACSLVVLKKKVNIMLKKKVFRIFKVCLRDISVSGPVSPTRWRHRLVLFPRTKI